MAVTCSASECELQPVDGSFCTACVPAIVRAARDTIERKDGTCDKPDAGFVYFIQSGKGGPLKVGYSSSPPMRRVAELQTGNPEALALIGYVDGSPRLESTIHTLWSRLHLRGEWFREGESLRQHIESGGSYIGLVEDFNGKFDPVMVA